MEQSCKSKKCSVNGCKNEFFRRGYFCRLHFGRIYRNNGVPLDNNIYSSKGENNVNWKGGVSEYRDHYKMKLVRIEKLKQEKGLCEVCGKLGYEVHHIDESKDNHNPENLILLCHKCHMRFFHSNTNKSKRYVSKFTQIYGMTIRQIAEKYGGTTSLYYRYHKQGKLKNYLQMLDR
jgi:5-methylcytosine-specific restriction endonuclease McrA